jgi:hypothetical protein
MTSLVLKLRVLLERGSGFKSATALKPAIKLIKKVEDAKK